MRGDTFISSSFWIRFCQLIFLSKLFEGENWHQSGYFDTLPSLLSPLKFAPRWRLRLAFFFLSKVMPNRVNILENVFNFVQCAKSLSLNFSLWIEQKVEERWFHTFLRIGSNYLEIVPSWIKPPLTKVDVVFLFGKKI